MPQNETTLAIDVASIRHVPVEPNLQQEIEQFLYFEAELLDDRRIEEWMALMAPDIHYFMPIHTTRNRRELENEWTGENDLAYFDEDKVSLDLRLRKLKTGVAWAEEPPSRTRHVVSNVRIARCDDDQTFRVRSNFVFFRTRGERQRDILSGDRQDVIRRSTTASGFEIARRVIYLDEQTLIHNNISFFL